MQKLKRHTKTAEWKPTYCSVDKCGTCTSATLQVQVQIHQCYQQNALKVPNSKLIQRMSPFRVILLYYRLIISDYCYRKK